MEGNFENTRDRLTRSEREINEARRAREQEARNADRAQREALEKTSPSGARRIEAHVDRTCRA